MMSGIESRFNRLEKRLFHRDEIFSGTAVTPDMTAQERERLRPSPDDRQAMLCWLEAQVMDESVCGGPEIEHMPGE